ncbi:hypothetical protein TWF718_006015 [Orbilia javanica]|uniref:Uncharacterized protein n=1 Tax=Orbilia javanica TaxID=47235 RepID=A0AAN8RE05_9PEZI
MHFSTLLNTAFVAVVSFGTVTEAHAVFVDAYGNADTHIHGFGLGHQIGTVRRGNWQWPQQSDITVFNKRPVHSNWWKGYLKNTCGVSIVSATNWYKKNKPHDWKKKGKWLWKQETPVGGYIDVRANTEWFLWSEWKRMQRSTGAYEHKARHIKNGIPRVTAGGVLNVQAWQVNADGGGGFKCRLDKWGTGNGFQQDLKVEKNCHGTSASINFAGVQKLCWFKVHLPKNMDCHGRYATGRAWAGQNICMVRCENHAKNGPFGGCIPIRQKKPAPAAPKPVVKPAAPVIKTVTIRPPPPPRTITVIRGNVITYTRGDIIAIPRTRITIVTRPAVVTVRVGQVITIIIGGVPRASTCTKAGVITVKNEPRVTVTEKSTVTVSDKSVVTVTENSVVTVTGAPGVVTETVTPSTVAATPTAEAEAEAVEVDGADLDPEEGDANKAEPTSEGTRTLTPEEIEAAKGGEEIDPADLEEAKDQKVDNETKEELKEEAAEAAVGGKAGTEVPDEVEDMADQEYID